MLYEIIKCTKLDSIRTIKEHYANINLADETELRLVIYKLNKLVDITNKNYNLIHSPKTIWFEIKAINAYDFNQINIQIQTDLEDTIKDYNSKVAIANKRQKQMNKLNHKAENSGIIKVVTLNDFNNPFVNYSIVYKEFDADVYLALGRE